jgi:predicted metal-binding protein
MNKLIYVIRSIGFAQSYTQESVDMIAKNIDVLLSELSEIHQDLKLISADIIVVADWVRFKCRYGCRAYGKHLCCPPFAPAVDETRRMISEYRYAVLVKFEAEPQPELLPHHIHHALWDSITKMHKTIYELERKAFLSGCYKAFGMGALPCTLCESCVIEEKLERNENIGPVDMLRCRHKDIMRPSMEACGIDVLKTLENAGYDSGILKDYSERVELFGLVLLD